MNRRHNDAKLIDPSEKTAIEEPHPETVALGRLVPTLIQQGTSNRSKDCVIELPETVIGREPGANVQIVDVGISRRHALIRYINYDRPQESPICVLEDCNSTNGTYLNGRRLEQPVELCSMDQIFIGKTCYCYVIQLESKLQSRVQPPAPSAADTLTGLMNRNIMMIQFEREFDRANRYGHPLALLLMNFDHFRRINAEHGRLFGDHMLRGFAEILKRRIRKHDLAARYSGDQFSAMLPHTPSGGAQVLAEQMRFLAADHKFEREGIRARLTISAGISGIVHDGRDSLAALIERAESALKTAKAKGRNRVVMF